MHDVENVFAPSSLFVDEARYVVFGQDANDVPAAGEGPSSVPVNVNADMERTRDRLQVGGVGGKIHSQL